MVFGIRRGEKMISTRSTRFGDTPEGLERDAQVKRLKREYKSRYGGLREITWWSESSFNLVTKLFLSRKRTLAERRRGWYPEVPHEDDVHIFRTKSGEVIFTSQPYFVSDVEDLRRDAEAFAAKHGLVVRVSIEESWHFPCSTVLVEYRRPHVEI